MRIGQEQVLPAVRQMPGFRGILTLMDAASGTGMTITLWESESALMGSEAAADRLRASAARDSGSKVEAVERYEVVTSEMSAHV
jgi:heme-degrading monooxygenase HmoA